MNCLFFLASVSIMWFILHIVKVLFNDVRSFTCCNYVGQIKTNIETSIGKIIMYHHFVLYFCRLPIPRPGEVLGLVGTNGIGKSTALKILAGKQKPNLGRFVVCIESVSGNHSYLRYLSYRSTCIILHYLASNK